MLDLSELSKRGDLFDGHYKLLRPLSTEGATADVWLAIDVNTIDTELTEDDFEQKDESGMLVAIKIYRPKNALDIEGEQRFREEYKIVFECRHANLLQPTGFSIYEDHPYLVLPFCRYGSAAQLIGKDLSKDEMWKFILDVSSGLNRLHTNDPQIVHQDIKPGNIMIDNTHNYAITDFGISSKRGGDHGFYYEGDNSGTLAYMGPERFQEETEPIPQSDIWAFGATLCEILTGSVPFGEEGGLAQIRENGKMPALPGVPPAVQRMIIACLDPDPNNRPTAQQLMEAARVRQFPVRSKWPIWVAAGVLFAGLVVGSVIGLNKPVDVPPEPPKKSMEEAYSDALLLMGSDDTIEFMNGYRQMDSLSRLEYIPAIYEMAFTHGWYSDEESLRRKEMLGIKFETRRKNRSAISMSDSDNQRALAWLQQIMEKNDSSYASINAQAAYRLAGYYRNEEVIKRDDNEVIRWMKVAKGWAELAGETELLEKIDSWLSVVERQY